MVRTKRKWMRIGTLCSVGLAALLLPVLLVGCGPTKCTDVAECTNAGPCETAACTNGECAYDSTCTEGQTCDEVNGVCFTPCDDVTNCTNAGPCEAAACTEGECVYTTTCVAGEVCDETADPAVCVPEGCTDDTHCDDGLFCNGAETCDTTTGDCVAGTAVTCHEDPDDLCTTDTCTEGAAAAECAHAAVVCATAGEVCDGETGDCVAICTTDDDCADTLFCNGDETCDPTNAAANAQGCVAGTPFDCDDALLCTTDTCNEGAASAECVHTDVVCDDLFECDPTTGLCVETPVCVEDIDCNDDITCTDDTCVDSVCVNADNCAVGLVCNMETGASACVECVEDAQCDAGYVCDLDTNTCSPTFSLRLTYGQDTLTGGSDDDYFDGSRARDSAGWVQTWNVNDQLNGGAGTDTLYAEFIGTAAFTPQTLTNFEILDLYITDATAMNTLNLANVTGLTTIKNQNSGAAMTITGVNTVPTSLFLTNTAANAFSLTTGTTTLNGTTDATTLTVEGITGATVTLQPPAAGSGFETINVVSTGGVVNTLTALTDGNGTSWTALNISGGQDLTMTLLDATLATINAGTFTGKLTFTDVAGSGAQVITGGTNDDVINMAGTYTVADTINGGTGTDRLTLTNAEATGATSTQTNVSNIEVVGLSDGINGTITTTYFGATGLRFGANMAGAGVVNYPAGTDSLDLQNFVSGGSLLTATIAGTATVDILNLTAGSAAAGLTFGAGGVTLNGAETVNILSQGGANSFGGAFTLTNTAAQEAIVLTGLQNITFSGVVTADSVNASGMTGTAILTMSGGGGVNSMTITGTANADTIIGGTAADIIHGGTGNDSITNRITGTYTTAADVLAGDAGNDTFTLIGSLTADAANYSGAPRITDFTVGTTGATDLLRVSGTDGDYYGLVAAAAKGLAKGNTAEGLTAADAMVIQSVAQNAAAAGLVSNVSLIKLTTGVAAAGTVKATFASAIGTATVTGLGAGGVYLVSLYDTTNLRMVLLAVDITTGVNTVLATGDDAGVTLIGTIDMSAADYASFTTTHLANAQ